MASAALGRRIPLPPWLQGKGFVGIDAPDDGNCFYIALADALYGSRDMLWDHNQPLATITRINKATNQQAVIRGLRNEVARSLTLHQVEQWYAAWDRAGQTLGGDVDAALDPVFHTIHGNNGQATRADVRATKDIIRRVGPPPPPLFWAEEYSIGTIEKLFKVRVVVINSNEQNGKFSPTPWQDEAPALFITLLFDGKHYEALSHSAEGGPVRSVWTWAELPGALKTPYCGYVPTEKQRLFGLDCAAAAAPAAPTAAPGVQEGVGGVGVAVGASPAVAEPDDLLMRLATLRAAAAAAHLPLLRQRADVHLLLGDDREPGRAGHGANGPRCAVSR